MDKSPIVTIVTITYNLINNGRKDYIIQNIKSVHDQTYKNIEHIIIDGASNDGTLELLKPYEEKGWIKIYSESDNGIYDAMNKGLNKANGEYITFLNSDDFYHNEHGIHETIKTLTSNECDFVYSTCKYITGYNNFYGTLKPLIEWFYVRMPFSHQTLFVKTKLMKELNGFDTHFKSAGDFDFIIRMFLNSAKGKECFTNFVSYRLGGLSDTQQEQSINETIKLIKKNFEPLISSNISIDWTKMYYDMEINEILFNSILNKVDPLFANNMAIFWEKLPYSKDNIKNISHLTNINKNEKIKKIKLFNLLTILKIKQDHKNKKWYLLGLPIFRIKQKNEKEKIYYLCFFPIFRKKY